MNVIDEEQINESFFSVGITGMRPQKLGGYDVPNPIYDITKKSMGYILDKYLTAGPREVYDGLNVVGPSIYSSTVLTGMALGCDQWMAEVCIDLEIPFIAAVPFKGQESQWPKKSQDHYFYLLEKAAAVCYISDPGYSGSKMQVRNEWIVDRVGTLMAVWDSSPGGTANCLAYAKKKYGSIESIGYKEEKFFLENEECIAPDDEDVSPKSIVTINPREVLMESLLF